MSRHRCGACRLGTDLETLWSPGQPQCLEIRREAAAEATVVALHPEVERIAREALEARP